MPDTTTATTLAPPIAVPTNGAAPSTEEINSENGHRPGLVILQEIASRLPDTLGVTPTQAALLNASVQVHASLGRFVNITASGLTLFRTSSRWAELGVTEHGARTEIFRHPPMKALAPEGTLGPFAQIYRAAMNLRPTYGAYYRWFDAYFVPFKAECKLVELFAALEARWSDERRKLIDQLPETRDWMQRHMRAAAAEAHDAYAATADPGVSRADFVERVLYHAKVHFPTPERVESKLRLALVDVLPPDMQPTAEMVEAVLGIKESVEAEARTQRARAEQAEAEAASAQVQLELSTMREQAEREMIREMHARRMAHADDMLRQEAEAQLAPHLAALHHAREIIAGAVTGALSDYQQGKSPSRQRIGSLRKAVELYELVSAGEVELDDKVAALKAIVSEPATRRKDNDMVSALDQVAQIAAIEAARAEVDAYSGDEWDALLIGENGHGE